jgi:hypothetical protein
MALNPLRPRARQPRKPPSGTRRSHTIGRSRRHRRPPRTGYRCRAVAAEGVRRFPPRRFPTYIPPSNGNHRPGSQGRRAVRRRDSRGRRQPYPRRQHRSTPQLRRDRREHIGRARLCLRGRPAAARREEIIGAEAGEGVARCHDRPIEILALPLALAEGLNVMLAGGLGIGRSSVHDTCAPRASRLSALAAAAAGSVGDRTGTIPGC